MNLNLAAGTDKNHSEAVRLRKDVFDKINDVEKIFEEGKVRDSQRTNSLVNS